MANRSYLYATDRVPVRGEPKAGRRVVGISEWGYDIPIVYKLLVSGGTRTCSSLIWSAAEPVGIVGEFDAGLEQLFAFLDRITDPAIEPLRQEAREFLTDPARRRRYFVLECAEVFGMKRGSMAAIQTEVERLVVEIRALEPAVDEAVKVANGVASANAAAVDFFADPAERFQSLGLGNWSDVLYYHFRGEES